MRALIRRTARTPSWWTAQTSRKALVSFGSLSKHNEIGPEAFGIVVCRFVGTVTGYFGIGLAQLPARIRPEIEGSRPDPYKCSGPC